MLSLVGIITASLIAYTLGQLDPILNYCIRYDHQSVVKNNTLYIDGGKESFIQVNSEGKQEGDMTVGINEYLIVVDLSQPWDWKTNVSIKALAKPGMPELPTSPPVVSRGAFYYGSDDDPNIYLWGGTTSYINTSFPGFIAPLPATYTMWSFNIETKDWGHYDMSDTVKYRPAAGAYAEARDQHRSFFLNGWIDNGTSAQTMSLSPSTKVLQEGMIVIDHSNQTAMNLSTKALVGEKPRARGKMQYISNYGENGIILLVGGIEKLVTDTLAQNQGDLVPFSSVDVFDVSSIYDGRLLGGGAWFKQKTTGEIPISRVDYCIFLARATDTSSANIYMYGGRGLDGSVFDDVHILSLPSFTWTKVYQGASGRYGHTCHRAGTRTMISVGGAPATNQTTGTCDWQTKGLNVFDISDNTWGSKYTKSTSDYEVPSPVVAKIGGNAQGNATMTAPAGGFDESGLAAIFGSTSVAGSPATPSPPVDRGDKAHHRRIIIASATSGGAVLLGLAFAIMWFFRRSLRRVLVGELHEHLEMDGKSKHQSELPGKAVFWELPGSGPAELWSPTESPMSQKAEEEFKFETRSDRELGWRGEIECVGDLAKVECIEEKAYEASDDDDSPRHAHVTCKELD